MRITQRLGAWSGDAKKSAHQLGALAEVPLLGWSRRSQLGFDLFQHLRQQSHYLFADRFGRPGKGNDKGKVEGLIGWIRRNLLVPVPRAASFTALNEQLLEGCRRRFAERPRGHDETIGERLVRDLAVFQGLPPAPYESVSLHRRVRPMNRSRVSLESVVLRDRG